MYHCRSNWAISPFHLSIFLLGLIADLARGFSLAICTLHTGKRCIWDWKLGNYASGLMADTITSLCCTQQDSWVHKVCQCNCIAEVFKKRDRTKVGSGSKWVRVIIIDFDYIKSSDIEWQSDFLSSLNSICLIKLHFLPFQEKGLWHVWVGEYTSAMKSLSSMTNNQRETNRNGIDG